MRTTKKAGLTALGLAAVLTAGPALSLSSASSRGPAAFSGSNTSSTDSSSAALRRAESGAGPHGATGALSARSAKASDKPDKDKPGKDKPKDCDGVLSCGDDAAMADLLEAKMADHLWYGLALPIDYGTAERIPGDVASIGPAWGDAGLWSGTYLAAESYRYALAKAKAARGFGKGTDHDEWAQEQAAAKERIDTLLSQMDLRTNIATSWQTSANPTVGSGTPPAVSYGGGIVQGEKGMLMYSCAPSNAPAGRAMQPGSDVRGPFRWNGVGRSSRLAQPNGDYVCEASTTRDTYAGVFFGLLTAYDLVAPDDVEVRNLIRDDILAMANFLLKYGWNYAHPHGDVNLPPFGDVYDNSVTPIMVISPVYRLGISQAALHVASTAGPSEEATKWQAVYAEEKATQLPSDVIAEEVNDPTPTAGYFSWNLAHLMFSSLIRLAANDPVVDAVSRQNFAIVDRQTSDDDNAFFETVTYAMSGEPARLAKAVTHLRQWRDYRARTDVGGTFDARTGCGSTYKCVPEDQFDLIFDTPAGEQRTTVPGSSTRLRVVDPLPVAQRAPQDFLWQRSPFTDLSGSTTANHQEPGIDYLLPYWMLRYQTEIAPPALNPLPVYAGPRYSGS